MVYAELSIFCKCGTATIESLHNAGVEWATEKTKESYDVKKTIGALVAIDSLDGE